MFCNAIRLVVVSVRKGQQMAAASWPCLLPYLATRRAKRPSHIPHSHITTGTAGTSPLRLSDFLIQISVILNIFLSDRFEVIVRKQHSLLFRVIN